jgi:aryl-alcohol dehydrogenase-like predicted oxidoreductase
VGIRVSPLVLGGMIIGDKRTKFDYGAVDKKSLFKLFDTYLEAGGQLMGSSNNQDRTSEEFIGEWTESRDIRDQIVLASKVGFDSRSLVGAALTSIRAASNILTMSSAPMMTRYYWPTMLGTT